ncbi:hypothetical protein DSM107133_04084 (plasmid) [Pseudosulfitobacter sp. DSM 107133]|nr:hypothetical protein DSM107133_04084 [Pseudosulfitobacter sp. DSM 107133]
MIHSSLTRRSFPGTSAASIACLSAGGPAMAQGNTFRFITLFSSQWQSTSISLQRIVARMN